ncbi:MAG: hypothetical protein ACO3JL_22040, partial [Myxococcota bacterium]
MVETNEAAQLSAIRCANSPGAVAKCLLGLSGPVTGEMMTQLHAALSRAIESGGAEGIPHLVSAYFLVRDERPALVDAFPAFFEHFDPLMVMLAVEALEPPLVRALLTNT